jgi:hypothetical protein
MTLFSEHSDVFSETWPVCGMTRSGSAFELPTPAPLMDGSASSSSPGLLPTPRVQTHGGAGGVDTGLARRQANGTGGPNLATAISYLLPTPTVSDTNGPGTHGDGGPDLRTAVSTLLPTPRATDGTKGGPNQRGSSGDLMLPSAVTHLLPTPAVNDMGDRPWAQEPGAWDAWTEKHRQRGINGNGHGKSLAIEA